MDGLVCTCCQTTYSLDEPRWRCDCGSVLDVAFRPRFDRREMESLGPTMWRYRGAIPVRHDASIVSFDEGYTPLIPVRFGDRTVLVKQDQLFSTGSYKDRGASVLISKVKELGVTHVVEDSSGNAGCAIAAYCANAGIGCTIYVPQHTSPSKLSQIVAYGADLVQVSGSREDTANAALRAAQDAYYASHSWNPFFFQGTKTFAFEVCEQLGWRAPDVVILPAGNGTLLLGAHIGFQELLAAGMISGVPRLVAVQAANCAPLHDAFHERDDACQGTRSPTLAEGIAIANPIRGPQAIQAVRDSGGSFVTVDEAEIEASLRELGSQGHYIEPTSAATTAAIANYVRESNADEMIVSVFTGHGLKAKASPASDS